MPLKSAAFNIVAHDKTSKSFGKVDKGLRGLKQSASGLSAGLKAATGAAIALAGPVALGAIVKRSLESVDALAKTSDKLGIATEELGALRHASELTGVSSNTLDMGLQRLTRRISEAAQGTGVAKDALTELGLNAQQLNLQSPHDAFVQIAGAMQNVESQSDRVRLAFKLFDSEGVSLVNTLALGEEGLARTAAEARRLGIAITRVDAANVEAANDAMYRLGQVASGVARTIAIQLSPFITAFSNRLLESSGSAEIWRSAITSAIEGVLKAAAFLADGFSFLKYVWKRLELDFARLVAGVSTGIDFLIGDILTIASYAPAVGKVIGDAQQNIESFAAKARAEVVDLTAQVAKLGSEPTHTEGIQRFIEEVRAADAEASKIAARQAEQKIKPSFLLTEDELEEAVEKHQEMLNAAESREADAAQRREQNRINTNAKIEAAEQRHRTRLESIELRSVYKLVRENQKAETALEKFRKMSWYNQVATVSSSLIQMTSTVASSSKAMFNINKIASIAQAVINTALGVTKALSAYPPPLSFAMAAAQAAAGIAQVSAIKSQSFNASGYVPSTPSGAAPSSILTPPPSVAPEIEDIARNEIETKEPKKFINISISGNPTSEQVRELIGLINEEVGDGAELMATTA